MSELSEILEYLKDSSNPQKHMPCILHRDKDPSMWLTPENGIWYCFGCGKGGDVVSLYQQYYGFTRSEAQTEMDYSVVPALSDDMRVSEYLEKHHITRESAQSWRLGNDGSRIAIALVSDKGVELKWRNLGGGEKYHTPTGYKPTHLFGWLRAVPNIRARGRAILVEAEMSVIRLHQDGFTHAVASGTSHLSIQQATRLAMTCGEVFLMYDHDDAGLDGMVQAGVRCLQKGVWPTVLLLPRGCDPCDVELHQLKAPRRVDFLSFVFERLGVVEPSPEAQKKLERVFIKDCTYPQAVGLKLDAMLRLYLRRNLPIYQDELDSFPVATKEIRELARRVQLGECVAGEFAEEVAFVISEDHQ